MPASRAIVPTAVLRPSTPRAHARLEPWRSPSGADVHLLHGRVAIAALLLLALGGWSLPAASPRLQLALAAAAILMLGVPHGAADILLWQRTSVRRPLAWLAGYVATVALLVALWTALPAAFLLAFFALSAWHFGDGDVAALPSGRLPIPLEIAARGSLPLLVPLLGHPDAARAAIGPLLPGWSAAAVATWTDGVTIALSIAPLAALMAALLLPTRCAGSPLTVLAEVLAIVAVGLALPPLLSFAAVFTIVHSTRHLLRIDAAAPLLRGRLAVPGILVTTAVAVGGGAGCWWIAVAWSPSEGGAALIRTLFVGLAALTAPHAWTVVRALGRAGQPACDGRDRHRPSVS